MKRSKIILVVLILSMITLVFSGCVGGGNPVVPPINNDDGEEEEIKSWDGSFAGKEWRITTDYNGPQANYFSNSLDNVWVDDQNPGRLHLKITYDDKEERWNSAQIESVKTLGGYGKYTFYIDNVIMEIGDGEKYNATELDKNVVIGLYTYDNGSSHPSKNEIDLEFSEWGDSGFKEGWFIVWEDASPGQLLRDRYNFTTQLVGKSSVHSFDWMENSIDFKSVSGIYNAFKNFGGDGYIPQPQNEKVLMNIWLVDGEPYSDNMKSAEIIISHFEFSSNDQDVPLPATPATVAPIITGVVGADDGYISADEVAYGLVVYGSGPAYAEIKIYINDIYVDTGDVLADGFWAVVVAKADLGADGAKTLYATATEDGLAESAHSNEVTFILDTTEGDSEEDDMFPAPTLYPIEIEGYAEIYYPTYVGLMYFTLSWTSVSGADGYRIDWAIDSPDPSNFEIYTNDDYLDFPDLVSETNAIFIEGSSYVVYWRVRARNRVSGKIGYWSNIQSVYCPSFDEVVWTPVP